MKKFFIEWLGIGMCLFLFVSLFGCLALSNSCGAVHYELHEFEKKAIESRLKIKKFHVTFSKRPESFYNREHSPSSEHMPLEVVYYLDGEKSRRDIVKRHKNSLTGEDGLTHIDVWTEDSHTNYSSGILESGERSGVGITKRHILDPLQYGLMNSSGDIRALGFASSGVTFKLSLSRPVGVTNRVDNSVQDDTINGVYCKKFCYYNHESGSRLSYWIAPSKGYSVIRAETKSNDNGCDMSKINYVSNRDREDMIAQYKYIYSVTSVDVAEYKNTGIWFPISMNYERGDGNGEIHNSEKYAITVHSLNESLDPKIFGLAGMDVPVGTYVMLVPDSGDDNYYWDGKKVAGEYASRFADQGGGGVVSFFVRMLLIITGLAMISMFFFLQYLAYRRKISGNQK
ncbi:MAG: hypothetical protein LBJ00_18315 [Planctomycetaceae bacterium]|jgi:hypothetical protein|nr:hypothetical protein [Planctomycetaceae bacterium]